MSSSPTDSRPSTTPSLIIHSHHSPHPYFTPTHLSFIDATSKSPSHSWQSRRQRKGRYAIKPARILNSASEQVHEVMGRVRGLETKLKPGLRADISFWLAVTFTFGSAIWVINGGSGPKIMGPESLILTIGYLVWFPILRPILASTPFYNTAAAFAFIGGTVFEIGSYLGVVEALDRGRAVTFSSALGEVLHHRRKQPRHTDESTLQALCEKVKLAEHGRRSPSPDSAPTKEGVEAEKSGGTGLKVVNDPKSWIWWGKPMWHDMGYLAAIVQMFAASIFWVSTITGLPGVIPGLNNAMGSVPIVDIFFWTPQVIGGCGFIVSSAIIMLEVQHEWYLPNVLDIGWQVGFWNLLGAFGFMLCGAFGYSTKSGLVYESGLSTFWGSWAFLIGGFFQTWETLWREPPSPPQGSSKSSV